MGILARLNKNARKKEHKPKPSCYCDHCCKDFNIVFNQKMIDEQEKVTQTFFRCPYCRHEYMVKGGYNSPYTKQLREMIEKQNDIATRTKLEFMLKNELVRLKEKYG